MKEQESNKIMKKPAEWTKQFNNLPDEIRTIACAVSNRDQINALNREKERLIKRHRQSLKEINDHIKSLEDWYSSNYGKE